MSIDDEFENYMRLAHADVRPDSGQWAISRNVFFAGMMATFGVLNHGGSAKQRARVLVDVQRQLLHHADRALQGMELGFSDVHFSA